MTTRLVARTASSVTQLRGGLRRWERLQTVAKMRISVLVCDGRRQYGHWGRGESRGSPPKTGDGKAIMSSKVLLWS